LAVLLRQSGRLEREVECHAMIEKIVEQHAGELDLSQAQDDFKAASRVLASANSTERPTQSRRSD
jgi:hypothetical protein